jgi:hypothetical protein
MASKEVFTNVVQNARALLCDGGHILVFEDLPSSERSLVNCSEVNSLTHYVAPSSKSDNFAHVNGTPSGFVSFYYFLPLFFPGRHASN